LAIVRQLTPLRFSVCTVYAAINDAVVNAASLLHTTSITN